MTAVFWLLAIAHTIGAGNDTAELWFLAASGAFVIPASLLLLLRWLGRAGGGELAGGLEGTTAARG